MKERRKADMTKIILRRRIGNERKKEERTDDVNDRKQTDRKTETRAGQKEDRRCFFTTR